MPSVVQEKLCKKGACKRRKNQLLTKSIADICWCKKNQCLEGEVQILTEWESMKRMLLSVPCILQDDSSQKAEKTEIAWGQRRQSNMIDKPPPTPHQDTVNTDHQ